jgi:glycosyltransferase involved in cell wall biosynthesis
MKVVITGNCNWTLLNFRLPLIKFLLKKNYDVYVIGPNDEYHDVFKKKKINFFPIDMSSHGTSLLSELKTFFNYFKIYKKIKPNLIHNFTIKPIIWSSLSAKLLNINNVINTVTGLGIYFYEKKKSLTAKIIILLLKVSCKKNFIYTFQNQDHINLFNKLSISNKSQSYLINGSGVSLFKSKKKNRKKKIINFLMYSRFIKSKGILEYVRAGGIIAKKFNNCTKFTYIGGWKKVNKKNVNNQWLDSNISLNAKYFENLCKKNKVTWIEHQNNPIKYLDSSDIFVLPTYYEGLPRSVLEAMSKSKLVITTNITPCKVLINNFKDGILVKPKSVSSLVKAMTYVLNNTEVINTMGNLARIKIKKKFSNKIILENYLNIYNKLLYN